jgi:hypothetical protein
MYLFPLNSQTFTIQIWLNNTVSLAVQNEIHNTIIHSPTKHIL